VNRNASSPWTPGEHHPQLLEHLFELAVDTLVVAIPGHPATPSDPVSSNLSGPNGEPVSHPSLRTAARVIGHSRGYRADQQPPIRVGGRLGEGGPCTTRLDVFDRSIQKSNEWLKWLDPYLGSDDRRYAYRVLVSAGAFDDALNVLPSAVRGVLKPATRS
jgi:hypothetical protein